MNARLEEQSHPEWMEQIAAYQKEYPLQYDDGKLTGPYIVEEIYRQTKGDAIITTEVGQHQMWAAQYYKYKEPRTLLVIRRTWNNGIWSWRIHRSQRRDVRKRP